MSSRDFVSVTIVTYNSGRFIRKCLDAVLGQKYPRLEVIVIDNASTDGTVDILEHYEDRCLVVYNEENIGFAAAQNQAIGLSRGDWVLTLNPDVFLLPGFLEALLRGAHLDPQVGTVCGKLFSMSPAFDIPDEPIVDSTGIYFTPMLRHFDRGSQECDNGHYLRYEYVFGATAAAACYRREMIEDVSIKGEFFDPDFFAYREDADLAWRSQLLGWKCLYVPYAKGYHVRKLRPGMRRTVPPEINMHSVKNRFLMRLKNVTAGLYLRHLIPITVRDLGILAYCLVGEQTSMKAFYLTFRNLKRVLQKRRWIQSRRRVDDAYIEQWFRFSPVSLPLHGTAHERVETHVRAASH
jgi:GT2 family glycosyltransferase